MATVKADTLQHSSGTGGVDVQGTNTNDAAAAGYVGEIITSTAMTSTTTVTADTEVDVTGASLVLTAGDWDVYIGGTTQLTNASGGATAVYGRVRMTDSSNTLVTNSSMFVGYNTLPASTGGYLNYTSCVISLSVASTTTYKLRITCNVSSATGVLWFRVGDLGIFTGTDNEAYFFARRKR